MTKRHYESMVLLNAALEDDLINNTINKIEEVIKINGGEIFDFENWGRKRLAYPIQKAKSGYYVIFRFSAPTDLIAKLERMYQLDEYVFRYITIVLDKFALKHVEKSKTQRTQTAEQAVTEISDTEKQPVTEVNSNTNTSSNV